MIRATALALSVMVSACQADDTGTQELAADQVWALKSLNGQAFSARATLKLQPNGTVTGHAACNRFSTRNTVPYPGFTLLPMRVTRMACPDLAAETTYLQALGRMSRSDIQNDVLVLRNGAGEELVFTASD